MKTRTLLLAAVLTASLPCLARAAGPVVPVIEVPATTDAGPDAPLMIMLTGDGGWAEFVREISQRLAAQGWNVVGLDLRKYLWIPRTPDETAATVDDIIRRYATKWHRDHVVLTGFSRGADLVPFVTNRLPPSTRALVELVVLLSPGRSAEFEFHLGGFLRAPKPDSQLSVLAEVLRLGDSPILMLYGRDDDEALALPKPSAATHIVKLPGDHHLGRDYPTIVGLIHAAAHHSASTGK
jgi:type IV secretory pathway VirJ component